MDHHVQEDLVLVHLVTKLLYLLLPISGSHTELVYFLGQIDLGKFFAQVLRFDLLLVNLVILLTLRKVFIIFLSPLKTHLYMVTRDTHECLRHPLKAILIIDC
jgi:hypothetical protein